MPNPGIKINLKYPTKTTIIFLFLAPNPVCQAGRTQKSVAVCCFRKIIKEESFQFSFNFSCLSRYFDLFVGKVLLDLWKIKKWKNVQACEGRVYRLNLFMVMVMKAYTED